MAKHCSSGPGKKIARAHKLAKETIVEPGRVSKSMGVMPKGSNSGVKNLRKVAKNSNRPKAPGKGK